MKLEDIKVGALEPRLISKVKRVEGDTFELTVKPPAGHSLMLCSACGRQDACKMFKQYFSIVEKVDGIVDFEVLRCSQYMPLISFTDMTGIDGHFNTFRYNTAWADRVDGVPFIRLVNKQGYFGLAAVKQVVTGTLSEMVEAHGRQNHLFKDDESYTPAKLKSVLARQYGGFMKGNIDNAKFTVIDLERIDKGNS